MSKVLPEKEDFTFSCDHNGKRYTLKWILLPRARATGEFAWVSNTSNSRVMSRPLKAKLWKIFNHYVEIMSNIDEALPYKDTGNKGLRQNVKKGLDEIEPQVTCEEVKQLRDQNEELKKHLETIIEDTAGSIQSSIAYIRNSMEADIEQLTKRVEGLYDS